MVLESMRSSSLLGSMESSFHPSSRVSWMLRLSVRFWLIYFSSKALPKARYCLSSSLSSSSPMTLARLRASCTLE